MITPQKVKAYRKSRNLTQAAFARECGVSQTLIRNTWEKTGIPDKDLTKSAAIIDILKWKQHREN